MTDIFNDFAWHSSYEPKKDISERKILRSLPAKEANLSKFIRAGKNSSLLIHKSSGALWKFKDQNTIIPVFDNTIILQKDFDNFPSDEEKDENTNE